MKKELIAFLVASAMVVGTGAIMAGCADNTEPEHTTHYDVNADGKCDKCGEDMEGHTHIYSKKWSSDADYHWHAATCAHDEAQADKAEHAYKSGFCSVCRAAEPGMYLFEAEDAILDDNDAPGNATMVIEKGKHEFTEKGKTDGPTLNGVGYFGGGAQGQTITWKINSSVALNGVKLTLRLASADGDWSGHYINEIDLDAEGAPTLTLNGESVSFEGQKLRGAKADELTQGDMNDVGYHIMNDIEVTVDLVEGENIIVLTSGTKGCNVDKIMIKTTETVLTFEKTDNSDRPGSH